jgi:heme exporter protein CcmD
MNALFSMGDYGFYVWTSVGLVCFSLMAITWRTQREFARLRKTLAWRKHVQS